MSISIWDLFKYLFKWKWVIAIITLCAYISAGILVDRRQTYSSRVIIQYSDSCISNGQTLDGKGFDANEIKAPKVILDVIKQMGYGSQMVDSIREKISISSITPTSVGDLKKAKQKLGEEYKYYPNSYIVSYRGTSSFESTRDILASVISNYFKYYSEKYLYLATLNTVDYSMNTKNFDYIEQAEIIEENVKQTIKSLEDYSKSSDGYRSPTIGLTFDDLLKEFESIREYTLPHIFSKIYEGQVTVNKDLMINKYKERMEKNYRDMNSMQHKAELAHDRMIAYVDANVDVPNSYNENDRNGSDNISIVENIDEYSVGTIDEQTTYDTLVNNFAKDSISANDMKIDAEHCQSVIDKFTIEKNESINFEDCKIDVEGGISESLTKLKVLYNEANQMINDYNSYIPALHIKKLSGVEYYKNISGSVYKLIAIMVGFGLSCVGAISYEIIKEYGIYSNLKEKEEDEEDSETEEEELPENI